MDPGGILLSISGLAALTYGLIRAGQVNNWSRTDVWAPIAAGLILLTAFVFAEMRVKEPSFDPRLLAQRMFGGGNAAMALLLFSVAAVTFYNAFYMQGALGFSPMKAGLANLPTAIGAVVGAPLGARLVRRWSLRPIAVPSLAVAALSMGAVGLLGLHTPLFWIEVMLLVQGLSVGMVLAPVTGALLSGLPLERSGAGSAVTNTARQAGSVIGIAVGGTIMSIAYRAAVEPSLGAVPKALRDEARVSAEQARYVAAELDRPALARAADQAYIHSMHVGAALIMVIGIVATAVLIFALRPLGKLTKPARNPGDEQGHRSPGEDDRAVSLTQDVRASAAGYRRQLRNATAPMLNRGAAFGRRIARRSQDKPAAIEAPAPAWQTAPVWEQTPAWLTAPPAEPPPDTPSWPSAPPAG
jgi:MFS transporter